MHPLLRSCDDCCHHYQGAWRQAQPSELQAWATQGLRGYGEQVEPGIDPILEVGACFPNTNQPSLDRRRVGWGLAHVGQHQFYMFDCKECHQTKTDHHGRGGLTSTKACVVGRAKRFSEQVVKAQRLKWCSTQHYQRGGEREQGGDGQREGEM